MGHFGLMVNDMFKKLLAHWRKIKIRAVYDGCYEEREYNGQATMGCCNKLVAGLDDTLRYPCVDCPYYVDLFKKS